MNWTHSRLRAWWTDDPADPGRTVLDDPDVQKLVAAISPESRATDLGGVMSLNVRLDAAGLVLRVHQPFVSRRRLLALQEVRRALAGQGLFVPAPVHWRGETVFRCRDRWAELEEYLPHERLAPAFDAYLWMFGAMGALHRALAGLELAVPHPRVATYAPPGSLRRWLPVTQAAVQGDPEAADVARLLRSLVRQLRRQWVPGAGLPTELIHGDVRLSNVCRSAEGRTVYLDLGFLALRPRVYDLAYALAFVLLALGGHRAPEHFGWDCIPLLVEAYESAAGMGLVPAERTALAPYAASVPLYAAALDGFTEDPAGKLRSRLPFLHLSEWLLAHPTALLGNEKSRTGKGGAVRGGRAEHALSDRAADPELTEGLTRLFPP
jgi:Ser/Thr protein kinase RdoA (MazF antagonist)